MPRFCQFAIIFILTGFILDNSEVFTKNIENGAATGTEVI